MIGTGRVEARRVDAFAALEIVEERIDEHDIPVPLQVPRRKTHVNRIFTKLGLRDRTQAVIVAYESGLVHPGDGLQP